MAIRTGCRSSLRLTCQTTSRSAYIRRYASFEATNVSVGRGTYYPFQVIGYPDRKYGDFAFTPVSLPGFDTNPLQKDKECYGIDLREYPFEGGLTLRFFLDFYNKAGKRTGFLFLPSAMVRPAGRHQRTPLPDCQRTDRGGNT